MTGRPSAEATSDVELYLLSQVDWQKGVPVSVRPDLPYSSTLAFVGHTETGLEVIAQPGIYPVDTPEAVAFLRGAEETAWIRASWEWHEDHTGQSRITPDDPVGYHAHPIKEVLRILPERFHGEVGETVYRRLLGLAGFTVPLRNTPPGEHLGHLLDVRPRYMEWVDIYLDYFPELAQSKPPPPLHTAVAVPDTLPELSNQYGAQ